jgi:VID27 PH-like domain
VLLLLVHFPPLTLPKPTKSAYSLSVRNWNSVPARAMASRPFSGAICKAMSTNFMNSLLPERMRPRRLSSRRACTAPCMNASIRQVRTIYEMKIWPNLCGSMFPCLPPREQSLSIFPSRPPASSRKGNAAAKVKKSSVKKKNDVKSPQSPASSGTSDPSLEVIIEEKAELFLWERDEGYFVREAAVSTRIVRRKGANFTFFLTATGQEGQVLAHRVSSQMMQRWSAATWSLTWNNLNESGNQTSWCLRFESQEAFEDFRAEFTKRAWESLNQTSWDKVKVCNANS